MRGSTLAIVLPIARPRRTSQEVLIFGGGALKLPLDGVDPADVGGSAVVTAALARRQVEAAPGERLRRAGTTQMNDGREVLLLLRRRLGVGGPGKDRRHVAVQVHGGELDGVARQHARVETVEPAAVLDDGVATDAI